MPGNGVARKGMPPKPRMDWAWFFDIDGTLVEIASAPSRIVVHDELPELIARLHDLTGGAVSLITGRSIADVDRLLPLEGISIAGQHGLDVRSATGEMLTKSGSYDDLGIVMEHLAAAVASHPGLTVEFKGSSVALHYRAAPTLAGYSHRLMKKLRDQFVPDFVIQKGKRVCELRPSGSDKGQAMEKLMGTAPFAGRRPVFIGDDATDEVAFKRVNDLGGYSVKVGPGATAARWRIANVAGVRDWLREGVNAADALTAPVMSR